MKDTTLLYVEKRISGITKFSFLIANNIIFIDVCKYSFLNKIIGINDFVLAILGILILSLWKKFSDNIFKNAYKIGFIINTLELIVGSLYILEIVTSLSFFIITNITAIISSKILGNSYVRIKINIFNKKELENFNNDANLIFEISSILASICLAILPYYLIVEKVLFIFATLMDTIWNFVIFFRFRNLTYND